MLVRPLSRLRIVISGGTVAAVSVALALPAPAGANDSLPKPGGAVASNKVGKGPKRVIAYWTRRRMSHATPLEVEPPNVPTSSPSSSSTAPAEPAGDPIVIDGDPPAGWEDRTGGSGGERLGRGFGPGPPGTPGPIAFTSSELTDTTAYPNRTHGNVFLTLGRSNYSCSATVVNSPTLSVVLTAGHCVHYGGKHRPWATNWVFVPGYQDAVAPFGTFVARELFTTKGWRKRARFAHDVGAAALYPNATGQTVESVVGSRGVAFNQPRAQVYRSFGYPVQPEPKFDGESLWVCDSQYGYSDPYPEPRGPAQSAIGCDMGAGSSGGGWVVNDQYVNSVNSFGYSFLPNVLFGTYFGDVAAKVYSAAVNG
jgi:V8-like Glu-specific endopeptidase